MGAEGWDYQLTVVVRLSDGAESLTGAEWLKLVTRIRDLAQMKGSMPEYWPGHPDHPTRRALISAGIGTRRRLAEFRYLVEQALRPYPVVHCTVMSGSLEPARPGEPGEGER